MKVRPQPLRAVIALCVVSAIFTFAPAALAHSLEEANDKAPQNLHELLRTWEFDPVTVIGLAATFLLYAVGTCRVWTTSGLGHGVQRGEATCFFSGWFVLTGALISPLHPLGETLFCAHMVQHELLMLVAAPLLVLGRPMIAFLHALPRGWASSLGRAANSTPWKTIWGSIGNPFMAWIIHAVVLWGWHAPTLFQATLHSEWVHAAQHISFLGSALLFWWAIIHGHKGTTQYGVAVLYLFTTAVHSGLLGALLTFARSSWYPDYDDTQIWGLSAIEDQQLGGLIMWIPACTFYIAAGLWLFAKWLRQSEIPAGMFRLNSERRSM